jgi:membrane protease YdiL (CAAX protease family)
MIEIAILLIVYIILIRIFEKENFLLGRFIPSKKIAACGLFLFCCTFLCQASGSLFRLWLAKEEFAFNAEANALFFINGIWPVIKSVLFEELLFRGVILYLLLRVCNSKCAFLLSSICFGIAHIYNIQSASLMQYVMTFAYPFLFGLVLAIAYKKYSSLLLPIAIHFGWNLAQNFIFPENIDSDTLLIIVKQPIVVVSYIGYFVIVFFPKIAALLTNFLILESTPVHNMR